MSELRRIKQLESPPIIGWFERGASLITLTPGYAHIVHEGRAFMAETPESAFSSKPETIAEKVSRFLR